MSDLSSPPGWSHEAIDPLIDLIGFRLSTATVLFHAAIADRLGVSATDVKCYSILRQTGPITAGELAERTGLTTGAITGVIDRLEQANLVCRVRDPTDRRRVVLELLNNPERERAIDQLYEPLGRAIMELVTRYSAAERATILDFLSKATSVLEAETRHLRQGAAPDHTS
jgi:DNA-binding MarR family transcriptional regulator